MPRRRHVGRIEDGTLDVSLFLERGQHRDRPVKVRRAQLQMLNEPQRRLSYLRWLVLDFRQSFNQHLCRLLYGGLAHTIEQAHVLGFHAKDTAYLHLAQKCVAAELAFGVGQMPLVSLECVVEQRLLRHDESRRLQGCIFILLRISAGASVGSLMGLTCSLRACNLRRRLVTWLALE